MRTIKFRGKRVDNGEWVYGNLITMNDKSAYGRHGVFSNKWIMEIVDELDVKAFSGNGSCSVWVYNDCIQVHPDTVGQYTGIKDKNGTEIYEGDEIKYLLAFGTGQTHTGDNIPGGSYTEPDEPFVYEVTGKVYWDNDRAMWSCSADSKEYGLSQCPSCADFDVDYVAILNRECYCIDYIKALCGSKCEECEDKDCWVLQQTESKTWEELEAKLNDVEVIGTIRDKEKP